MSAGFDPGTGLGPRLRLAREERQLSVRELARRLGCSASLISQIERGISIPSVGVLYSLATELGSSLDYLLFGSGAGPGTGRDDDAGADAEADAVRIAEALIGAGLFISLPSAPAKDRFSGVTVTLASSRVATATDGALTPSA